MVLTLLTVTLFSCANIPKNEETKEIIQVQTKTIPVKSDSLYEYLTENNFAKIKSSKLKWFNSWNQGSNHLNLSDFNVKWKKTLDFDWIEYDPYDKYLVKYDTLLIYSENKLALDLYSFNTVIDIEGANTFVGFDVDSKVYVADKIKKERAEIANTGSYEVIEDGLWLDNKRVVLLGYTAEDANRPFVWVIDIFSKKQVAYSCKTSFNKQRSNYFLVKYPKVKLRAE